MNELSIITSSHGKIGSLEKIMPEFLSGRIGSIAYSPFGAVGMTRTKRIMNMSNPHEDILSSIIINKKNKKHNILEFHGVLFFKPLEAMSWEDQISGFKVKPSMFEAVSPFRLENKTEYLFYSQRVYETVVKDRKKL